MSSAKKKSDGPTVIKKYANRRLYDTGRSSYVTLDDLCTMVKEERDFVVYDAKSGEDLTRSVLTQIIVEQEAKGENLLPISFLRQMIGFYGDNMQNIIPGYLEQTIETFAKNQEEFRDQMNKSLQGMMQDPVSAFEEMGRKNMEMFQSAMKTWAPFSDASPDERVRELQKTMADMQKEIDRLSGQD